MKKLNILLGMMLVLASSLHANDATDKMMDQNVGLLQNAGLIIIGILVLLYFVSPFGGYFFGKKMAKKKAEQDQDEAGGFKAEGYGFGGAVVAFFIMFTIVGYVGSVSNPANTTGDIDFAKGNNYVISSVFGALLTKTKTEIAN